MRFLFLLATCIFSVALHAQNENAGNGFIVSGPMIGNVELRTAVIWMQFGKNVSKATLWYKVKEKNELAHKAEFVWDDKTGVARAMMIALEPGTVYTYSISVNGNKQFLPGTNGEVTTQSLWQWRTTPPDFSFITGSCAYFNEPVYDRPGTPYGSDSVIFSAMAKENAAFMLWLGDNWYLREVDMYSQWGLQYRASRDRSLKILQPFLKSMPHYAIWDDHDYGWDNADKSFPLKQYSRNVFKKYWNNPTYGQDEEGIYTKFSWNDVDVFMLDDRWFRSSDAMPDSIDGQPNAAKKMFGPQQMEWLKNALLQSNDNPNISFRIIATGSQVLNPMSPTDCFRHYPAEYQEMMDFIKDNRINGVVFITGDRHHSEIIKQERKGTYPLYDITASSLTAGISATKGQEKSNPDRVTMEVTQHNYARVSFSGSKSERKMTVAFVDKNGRKIIEWSVLLKDVSVNRP